MNGIYESSINGRLDILSDNFLSDKWINVQTLNVRDQSRKIVEGKAAMETERGKQNKTEQNRTFD